MGICICMKVLILFFINVLYGWFQVPYIFSLVKCDMFVDVICYQNIDRCFAFNVVNSIHIVYIGVLSFG